MQKLEIPCLGLAPPYEREGVHTPVLAAVSVTGPSESGEHIKQSSEHHIFGKGLYLSVENAAS